MTTGFPDALEVMRRFDADGADWCGWMAHRNTEDPSNILITCDVDPEWARTMPGDATRHGVAMALHRYSAALAEAGFGVAYWTPPGLLARGLIVAADQAAADRVAPGICARLDDLNPVPAKQPLSRKDR